MAHVQPIDDIEIKCFADGDFRWRLVVTAKYKKSVNGKAIMCTYSGLDLKSKVEGDPVGISQTSDEFVVDGPESTLLSISCVTDFFLPSGEREGQRGMSVPFVVG
jgi:hypothetical protein